jgi:hypothetical protein
MKHFLVCKKLHVQGYNSLLLLFSPRVAQNGWVLIQCIYFKCDEGLTIHWPINVFHCLILHAVLSSFVCYWKSLSYHQLQFGWRARTIIVLINCGLIPFK